MAITIGEKIESRRSEDGPNGRSELVYVVRGTDDELIARAEVETESPESYEGRTSRRIALESQGHELWEATVSYTAPQEPQVTPSTNDVVVSFDTSGGTQHITQSLQTMGSYNEGAQFGIIPNFFGAIGVTNNSVEGVDIVVPVFAFSETHYLTDEVVTASYRSALFALTGKVNDGDFREYAEGEVLFMGVSGARRGSGDWELTFKFQASPNRFNFNVGPILVEEKRGWDYMWVRYEEEEDLGAYAVVKRPVAVVIERVYPRANFAGLGIQ